MIARTQAHREALRTVGAIAAEALAAAVAAATPGATTSDLDAAAAAIIAARGARSAPALVYGFPATICVSLNDQAAHGVPGPGILQPGDLVNIDACVEKNGYYADCAKALVVGDRIDATAPHGPAQALRLAQAAAQVMEATLPLVRSGMPWRSIGAAIEREASARGFSTIRDLFGHGTGRAPHEAPDCLEAWDNPANDTVLREGQVLAVEFFLTRPPEPPAPSGTDSHPILASLGLDGWTLRAPHGCLVAQAELSLIVGEGYPEILTPLD